ncbi:hypothetical protein KCU73_g10465, partial [Aureobasidium melanogenum]
MRDEGDTRRWRTTRFGTEAGRRGGPECCSAKEPTDQRHQSGNRWQESSSNLRQQGLGPHAEDAVPEDDITKAKVVAPEFEAPKVKMTDKKTGEETAEPVDRLMLGMRYWETRSWLAKGEEP